MSVNPSPTSSAAHVPFEDSLATREAAASGIMPGAGSIRN